MRIGIHGSLGNREIEKQGKKPEKGSGCRRGPALTSLFFDLSHPCLDELDMKKET